MASSSLPHVVVAHGSWHTPEIYSPLKEALEKRGYEVTIPSHPTTRPDGIRKILSDDCQFFRAELQQLTSQGREVVVVMHSYGGMVGAGSVHGLEKKPDSQGGIVALVFMTCFIPGATGGLADGVGGQLPPWIQFKTDEETGIRLCFVPEDFGAAVFYEPYSEAKALARRLNPQPASTQYDALVGGPGYAHWTIPMLYTICDMDQALLPQYQEVMIQNAEKNLYIKIETIHIDGTHFPFQTVPEKCADAVDHVLGRAKKD